MTTSPMERPIFLLILFTLFTLPSHSQNTIGSNIFGHLKENALVLHEEGILREPNEIQKFVESLVQHHKTTYIKEYSIEVNAQLTYEAGKVQIQSRSYSVMFLKETKDEYAQKMEFLVIFRQSKAAEQRPEVDQARMEWMRLCNSHQAGELVKQLYTNDAYYYNRGRLIQGTETISQEYSYMNRPSYSLQLTPKYVTIVSDEFAFEIGQCSGSYPLPYMLLWQKQSGGKWQVLMDTNY